MLSILDWIEAIRFRWKLVALGIGGCVGLAILYLAVAPRTYVATSSLLLDVTAPDPVAEDDAKNEEARRSAVATQADLVRSPNVAGEAAKIAGLQREPAYRQQWLNETGGKKPFIDWIRPKLIESVEVEPGKDTNVLSIQVAGADPDVVAKLATAFATASVAAQFRLRTEPANAYAGWLTKQVASAGAKVIDARNAMSGFVKTTGITNNGDLSSEGSQMAEVATQLAAAEGRAAAARQPSFAAEQARGDAERSSTVQQLRTEISTKSGKLSDLRAMFGPEYPDVQRNQAELQTLQARLNAEQTSTSGAFAAARGAQASSERVASTATEQRLRSLAQAQRSRMLNMGSNLAEYARLKNEFDLAQRTFNDLNVRLNKMRLQGNIPQTGVQVLDKASLPGGPTSPRVGLTLALALLLGGLLGSAAAIFFEFRNPRVRSWGGVERLLGVHVVGRVALPKRGPLLLERMPG